ncbi:MAG: hypothetical protein OEZ22_04690 [Spirochaetia bacterium]|nr:hypothetical protein [Spirochaetia bacterium]
MKVIETKYIKISYVIPENKNEDNKIKKIIEEVKEENNNFNPSEWISDDIDYFQDDK